MCFRCAGIKEQSTQGTLFGHPNKKTPLLDNVSRYGNNEIAADFKALAVSLNKGSGAYLLCAPSML